MRHFNKIRQICMCLLMLAGTAGFSAAGAEAITGFICASAAGYGNGDTPLMSAQEEAAYQWFIENYYDKGKGEVLHSYNLSGLDASTFKCVWIHIDREHTSIGWRNLPAEFTSPDFIRAIHDYMLAGGNLYLTGQATQLVLPIWRVNSRFAVNNYDAGPGVQTRDIWSIRTDMRDGSGAMHPIFSGLTGHDDREGVFGILGGGDVLRENHNTMWRLPSLQYRYGSTESDPGWGEDLTDTYRFEKDNQATVLATFDWDTQGEYAGIVEFHPVFSWNPSEGKYNLQSGSVICNGMSAMQWGCNTDNECRHNLERLTENTISYLMGSPVVKEGHPYCLPSSDDSVEIIESTGLIAMYLDYPDTEEGHQALKANAQEYAAYKYFVDNFVSNTAFLNRYGNRAPEVLWKDDIDKIRFCGQEQTDPGAEGFECLWINIDRPGLHGEIKEDGSTDYDRLEVYENGIPAYRADIEDFWRIYATGERPEGGRYREDLTARLKEFIADGGNIYTSKWANMMLGDMKGVMAPTQVTSKEKDEKDGWGMNVSHGGYDRSGHPVLQGLELYNEAHGTVFYLFQGAGIRRDANCLWWLDDAHCGTEETWTGDASARLEKFNKENNATVIGVWGHNAPEAFITAGLVEFHPQRTGASDSPERVTARPTVELRRGTVMANGFGTYEWETHESTTDTDENVKRLTSNILAYLTPVMTEPTYTGVEETGGDADSDSPVYYNLQGIRVENPGKGIFIEIRGGKSRLTAR